MRVFEENLLTSDLGSKAHDERFDAVQLTPEEPSPRYHSSDNFSIVRVVSREDNDISKVPGTCTIRYHEDIPSELEITSALVDIDICLKSYRYRRRV